MLVQAAAVFVERAQDGLHPLPVKGPALAGAAGVLGIDLRISNACALTQGFGKLGLKGQEVLLVRASQRLNRRRKRNVKRSRQLVETIAVERKIYRYIGGQGLMGLRAPTPQCANPCILEIFRNFPMLVSRGSATSVLAG
jgi:hypothetical protein